MSQTNKPSTSSLSKLPFAQPRGVPSFPTSNKPTNDGFKVPSLVPDKKEKEVSTLNL